MNKHTPGPWYFRSGSRSDEFVIRDRDSSGGFAPLALVKGDKRSTLAQGSSNARLMAAAPFLLDALKELLDNLHDTECNDAIFRATTMAKAAIVKATGDSYEHQN